MVRRRTNANHISCAVCAIEVWSCCYVETSMLPFSLLIFFLFAHFTYKLAFSLLLLLFLLLLFAICYCTHICFNNVFISTDELMVFVVHFCLKDAWICLLLVSCLWVMFLHHFNIDVNLNWKWNHQQTKFKHFSIDWCLSNKKPKRTSTGRKKKQNNKAKNRKKGKKRANKKLIFTLFFYFRCL